MDASLQGDLMSCCGCFEGRCIFCLSLWHLIIKIFFSIESLENTLKPDTDIEQEVVERSSRGKSWPCLCRRASLFDFRAVVSALLLLLNSGMLNSVSIAFLHLQQSISLMEQPFVDFDSDVAQLSVVVVVPESLGLD